MIKHEKNLVSTISLREEKENEWKNYGYVILVEK